MRDDHQAAPVRLHPIQVSHHACGGARIEMLGGLIEQEPGGL
ncbi:hypothetical protein [Corallococcus sp. CA053C]|nr:hypothetical protein [Corallococcus sp. CA053C]